MIPPDPEGCDETWMDSASTGSIAAPWDAGIDPTPRIAAARWRTTRSAPSSLSIGTAVITSIIGSSRGPLSRTAISRTSTKRHWKASIAGCIVAPEAGWCSTTSPTPGTMSLPASESSLRCMTMLTRMGTGCMPVPSRWCSLATNHLDGCLKPALPMILAKWLRRILVYCRQRSCRQRLRWNRGLFSCTIPAPRRRTP